MDLDFIETTSNSTTIPREHLKSSTVETLLSQNEDLMTKLKTAYRRLSSLEEQNQQLVQDQAEQRRQISVLHDQAAVLKEKDQAWKHRLAKVEEDKDLLLEKNTKLQQLTEKQEIENARHQKYHDKVKTQIKPYIQQLKKYSQELELQLSVLHSENEQKEALVRDLRFQILELARNSKIQSEDQESRLIATVDSYEKTVEELNQTKALLAQQLSEAETRILKYHKVQERFDRLENDMIELRRSRDTMKAQLEEEVVRLQDLQNQTHREKSHFESQTESLKEQLESKSREAFELQQERLATIQQTESLRYLFGQKSQENEKLKLSQQSLEKLNVELSQKIYEIRLELDSSGI